MAKSSSSPSIYKGKKLTNKQNIGINVSSYTQIEEVPSFAKFFHVNEGLYGRPTCIACNQYYIVVGTESSAVLFFHDTHPRVVGLDFTSPERRGSVMQIVFSADGQYVCVAYQSFTIALYKAQNQQEVHVFDHFRPIRMVEFMPVQASSLYLQQIGKDTYYELLVLDQQSNITRYSIELDHQHGTIRREQAMLYKCGVVCSAIKVKNEKPAKIYDPSFQIDSPIIHISVMNESYVDDIAEEDSMNTSNEYSPPRKSRSDQKSSTTPTLLQRLFKRTPQNQIPVSTQYTLIAVLYPHKIEVVKVWFGKFLNEDQSVIKVVLEFNRPNAQIYDIVFPRVPKQQPDGGMCVWGLGCFKETNKRYVLLVVDWGGQEFYAFKVMRSVTDVSVVQGGHFYLDQPQWPLFFDFVSNSIFVTIQNNQLLFLTTQQFEYGVPFSMKEIAWHAEKEKMIQNMNQGYVAKYTSYKTADDTEIRITHGLMESIREGYQSGFPLELPLKSKQLQVHCSENRCFILNGCNLSIVKLKKWNEYLEELTYSGEWSKVFSEALAILEGRLTLMSGIPENDKERLSVTKPVFCKLAYTYLLTEMRDFKELSSALQLALKFLLQTHNQDYLFGVVDDLLVSSGHKGVFYQQLCYVLQEMSDDGLHFEVPAGPLLHLLNELKAIDRLDVVQLIVFNLTDIHFDTKPLVDFLVGCEMVLPMLHVCLQTLDYLTPYLKIMTALQVKMNDENIIHMSVGQLGQFALDYIRFCLSGQKLPLKSIDSEKGFRIMLRDIFEYLFDLHNLSLFLRINYHNALEVLLLVFQKRIQDVLQSLPLNIRMPKTVQEGLYKDILEDAEHPHLEPLRRIYVLIKQAELTFFTQHQGAMEYYNDISMAFTTHVLTQCPLNASPSYAYTAINRYITVLKEDAIFDISWVMIGKVQKNVEIGVLKNEFLWVMAQRCEQYLRKYLKQLLDKARDENWVLLECYCLLKLDQIDIALTRLLQEPNPALSDKIFTILNDLRNNEITQLWVLFNLHSLAQENSQKLFAVLIAMFRRDLNVVMERLKTLPMLQLDAKQDHALGEQVHVSDAFVEYLRLRLPHELQQIKLN